MTKRRVVITGVGAITPIGSTAPEYWDGLINAKSGVSRITRFDPDQPADIPVKIAAEIRNFDPLKFLTPKEVKRLDRFVQYAVIAANEAIQQANLKMDAVDATRVATIIGSGIGGMETFEDQARTIVEKGPRRVSPFFIPMMIADLAAGEVSIRTGAKGPNYCTVSACASGAHAIGESFRTIQRGDADAAITGGSEAAITPLSIAGFANMKALCSDGNDHPETASRPFDLNRSGFVLGEGAGIVILEELEHAKRRGAPILAEMVGYCATGDAYHITAPAPGGEGAIRSMSGAIRDAGIQPQEVDYINAHGTSTPYNDKNETAAIKSVFGDHAYKLAVSSTKSMTGHSLGASGAIEFVALAYIVQHDKIPPTINYQTPDPECDLDYVPNEARNCPVRYALSNSFGFGGHNVSLIVKKYEA